MQNTVTRQEARAARLARYFTGKPCKHGHVTQRYVANGRCVECSRAGHKSWTAANPGAARHATARWIAKNPDYAARKRGWDAAYKRRWRKENSGKHCAQQAKRRADLLQRTPKWADIAAIEFFYECCPAGYHVDHIAPLKGRHVSGLHVESNLQWLPAHVNLSKWANFNPQ